MKRSAVVLVLCMVSAVPLGPPTAEAQDATPPNQQVQGASPVPQQPEPPSWGITWDQGLRFGAPHGAFHSIGVGLLFAQEENLEVIGRASWMRSEITDKQEGSDEQQP